MLLEIASIPKSDLKYLSASYNIRYSANHNSGSRSTIIQFNNRKTDLKQQNSEIQTSNTDFQKWMEFSSKMYEEMTTKLCELEK